MGKSRPQGRPVAGFVLAGPVVTLKPSRALRFARVLLLTMKYRSVSKAFPGPMAPSHHPGSGCRSSAGPAAQAFPAK